VAEARPKRINASSVILRRRARTSSIWNGWKPTELMSAILRRMRVIQFSVLLAGLAAISGCNISNDFQVTAFKTVEGADSAPWPSGCMATVENRNQKIVAVFGLPCEKIQVGDRAVFNHKGDTVLWINNNPFTVRSAQAK